MTTASNEIETDMDLNKNTFQDKLRVLSEELDKVFDVPVHTFDCDEEYVYFRIWVDDTHLTARLAYSITDLVNVEFFGEPEEIVMLTEPKVKNERPDDSRDESEPQAPSISSRLIDFVSRNFNGSDRQTIYPTIKQFNDEEMIAYEPLYIAVGEVDGHGDTIDSVEEMESLVKSFNEANEKGVLQSSLFHKHKTNAFKVVKAWVNECECMIGDHLVPEGQPLVKIKFHSHKAWELRKEGRLCGVSIGARAMEVEEVEE